MTTANMSPGEERQHFIGLLRKFRTAMLVTVGVDQHFHPRPMAIAEVEDDGRLWFLTSVESAKVSEIQADSHVCVTAQDEQSAFIALTGRARLVHDPAKIDQIWNEAFRVWFPGGKDDADLELIAITPQFGEYWDNSGVNRASYLWEAAKAYVTGTTPEIKEGQQHGKVLL